MTDREHRDARDLGSDAPASDEAAEQTRSGSQGATRGEGDAGGTDRQPPQSSGRTGPGPKARARKHYEEDEAPSEQGDGSPSPERISRSSAQQGQKPRSGSRAAAQDRGEDEATVE